MAPKQYKGSFDYLNTLSTQQLRGILRSELEEEEVNVELIKKINTVMASKSEKKDVDVDAAYENFKADSDTDLLFDEVLDETNTRNFQVYYNYPKVRYLTKIGTVAAIVALLFIGTSTIAYAMGFNVWGAISKWTENRFGFFAGENVNMNDSREAEDVYKELKDLLDSLGVPAAIVPNRIPKGYKTSEISQTESLAGLNIFFLLECDEQNIILHYILLKESPSTIFTKDDGEPEVYTVNGIDHFIFSNDGNYRATWLNENAQCSISGFTEKDELLKIIDSIYEG